MCFVFALSFPYSFLKRHFIVNGKNIFFSFQPLILDSNTASDRFDLLYFVNILANIEFVFQLFYCWHFSFKKTSLILILSKTCKKKTFNDSNNVLVVDDDDYSFYIYLCNLYKSSKLWKGQRRLLYAEPILIEIRKWKRENKKKEHITIHRCLSVEKNTCCEWSKTFFSLLLFRKSFLQYRLV